MFITDEHELKQALQRAAAAHHIYEEQTGQRDEDWAGWYAKHIVGEWRKYQS